ncbi:hypothetical protein LWC08_15005 [Desulfobaculum bizertense]|uniref:hypothetical protein n=1 Tax=Desulfobaculum bizertense TaxID=376490 RepID=UPI001F3CD654|nr:hypothetical protein [Desulfobaculum bizertense]UIJ37980.1 hypothetical protein LWC08_15005 [Desulfobaculum bizertense]
MQKILTHSERNQKRAWEVIKDARLFEIWEEAGARAELVGSLRSGLLMTHLDIDFHIYSEAFTVQQSFSAVAKLASNPRVSRIEYTNLLETDEKCLEWHAWYKGEDGDLWQIDMIHILSDSPFAGYFERVADAIKAALTPETKLAILRIKKALDPAQHIPSIAVYQAVIDHGVRDYDQFQQWLSSNPPSGIIQWLP